MVNIVNYAYVYENKRKRRIYKMNNNKKNK